VEDPVIVTKRFLGMLSLKEFEISSYICGSYDQKSSAFVFVRHIVVVVEVCV